MGNSLSILTKCLPQEPTEEVEGEENDKASSVLEQKKKLAPTPIEEEEDWGEFEDTFTNGDKKQQQPNNKEELQKKLKAGPLNSSRDNVLPLSSSAKTQKEFSLSRSFEKNQFVNPKVEDPVPLPISNSPTLKDNSEGIEKQNGRLSLTQAQTGMTAPSKPNPSEPMSLLKTQAKDIPSPSNKDKAKNNAPVRSPKMAEEKPQDPTNEPEVDFFSDMTVQYVPPKKAEKHNSNDQFKTVNNSSNVDSSLPRKISLEREEDEEKSSLGKISFLSDENEEDGGVVGGGGWGNDDLGDMEGINDVDSDHNDVKEKDFKSPIVGSSESAVDSPRSPRKENKATGRASSFGDDNSDF
eukprot:TRINITY_DN6096_c2_g1_i2.p1 TRINITY_DN6096_c2_g1~~TRINITY_DN6096_c2_g1_i2.p1  ORF type:complete len:352 (-),score=168.45 TRINITY_DN6096_c2_g1_i2:220-1275(-)